MGRLHFSVGGEKRSPFQLRERELLEARGGTWLQRWDRMTLRRKHLVSSPPSEPLTFSSQTPCAQRHRLPTRHARQWEPDWGSQKCARLQGRSALPQRKLHRKNPARRQSG